MENSLHEIHESAKLRKFFPYVVLVVSLSLGISLWLFWSNQDAAKEQLRYREETKIIASNIIDRLHNYEMVLQGFSGLFAVSEDVTRNEWQAYYKYRQVQTFFPGVQAIAFSRVVQPPELARHIQGVRADGFPDYTVRPEGKRDVYTAIIFLEPFDARNQRAFGYDMFSEPVRRAAMERARDTGAISISGKVTLVQETDEKVQAGFLMYVPIYAKGVPLNTIEERRAALTGYVYSPFRMNDLMRGIFSDPGHYIDFKIYDGTAVSPAGLMYESDEHPIAPDEKHKPMFSSRQTLDLYGHQWTLAFETRPPFEAAIDQFTSWGILAAGIVISLLLFLFTQGQENTRERASSLAIEMTKVLNGINKVFRESLTCETEEEVAYTCLSVVEELTGSKFGFIGEVNPAGRFDTIVISNPGWDACKMPASVATILNKNMEIRGIDRSLIKEGKSRIVNDPTSHPDRVGTPEGHPPITSFLGVPLKIADRTIGMIGLANKESGYNTEDQEAIEALAIAFLEALTRKRAEVALQKSKEMYRNLVESISDWVWLCDAEGRQTFANEAVKTILGYEIHEVIGASADSLMHLDDGKRLQKLLLKSVEEKRGWKNTVLRWKHKDGTIRFLESTARPILDSQGGVVGFTGINRDITERKRMEGELLRSQKMESIGTLAGGIAHDFNNILTSVIGYTELSLDEVEKGTHIENNLQEIYTAGNRAKDLVRQILAFARQSEEELKPIQVDMIATEVLKFIRSTIPTTIEIKQNIESDSLIMGNATQVHQILMNLFTNAAHAMEDNGGILEFSLKDIVMDRGVNREKLDLKPGNYIEIKVSDTGVGIAPEIIGSIFDPYFTTKGPGEGTGMGLAMVHGIIESYGGKILVDSKPGQGTLFTIYFPGTRKRQEHRPYQSETLPTGKERILFVDDEAPIAKMGGQALERLGYTVSIRTSSIEALELFRSKPNDFDLVITDMTMPNMTGDKLAVELMKIRSDIPVILCTGYSKTISDDSATAIGIRAFAYKPVVKADLAKTVRKVLDDQQPKQITGRILVIDDESEIRKLFIQKLAGKGYEIIEACDGKEGLKLYHENRPDLVITDLIMPEKEGIETITELKREFPDVKIIAISGGGRNIPDAYLQIAKNLGAERTFPKPIDWPELIKAVRELLK